MQIIKHIYMLFLFALQCRNHGLFFVWQSKDWAISSKTCSLFHFSVIILKWCLCICRDLRIAVLCVSNNNSSCDRLTCLSCRLSVFSSFIICHSFIVRHVSHIIFYFSYLSMVNACCEWWCKRENEEGNCLLRTLSCCGWSAFVISWICQSDGTANR